MSHTKEHTTATPSNTIALTGATGFVGKKILYVLLKKGYHVRALTRRPQKERDGVTWIAGNLDDMHALEKLCKNSEKLIHTAGLVKALNRSNFFDANLNGSKAIFKAAAGAGVSNVIYISSLAAREPRLSHYAASKAAAESTLMSQRWPFHWTILRPSAVYGPEDMEILKLLKLAKLGFLIALGSQNNRFSMIHVDDLANIIAKLNVNDYKNDIVEIDDNKASGYTMRDMAQILSHHMGRHIRTITLPSVLVKILGAANELIASATHRPSIFTLPKARELTFHDWSVRSSRRPLQNDNQIQYKLPEGIKNTIEWYRQNSFL